jgi:peptidoglycan/LPS O-acetylase OafA/YrhL
MNHEIRKDIPSPPIHSRIQLHSCPYPIKRHSYFWVWIGRYSYSIYLFHGFATSGVRILMRKASISDITPIFITVVILSALLPMLVDKIVSHKPLG